MVSSAGLSQKKHAGFVPTIKKVGTLPAKSKVPIVLFGSDLAVLPGHPSDLTADLHGMPAILGSSDPLALRPVRHSGNAAILNAIARADVYRMVLRVHQQTDLLYGILLL